jgi:hypothetical protein
MRHVLAAALVVTLSATAAMAGDAPKPQIGQYVDLQPVAIPVVDGGRLRNYVFVNVRLTLSSRVDPNAVRPREPYFRDALVRTAHRTPFVVPGDWNRINEAALKDSLYRQASAIAGPGAITGVVISSATPQRRVGMNPSAR